MILSSQGIVASVIGIDRRLVIKSRHLMLTFYVHMLCRVIGLAVSYRAKPHVVEHCTEYSFSFYKIECYSLLEDANLVPNVMRLIRHERGLLIKKVVKIRANQTSFDVILALFPIVFFTTKLQYTAKVILFLPGRG